MKGQSSLHANLSVILMNIHQVRQETKRKIKILDQIKLSWSRGTERWEVGANLRWHITYATSSSNDLGPTLRLHLLTVKCKNKH